ncbi:MAG: CRTAC1 family protein [Vicinamibacterales bacterium]
MAQLRARGFTAVALVVTLAACRGSQPEAPPAGSRSEKPAATSADTGAAASSTVWFEEVARSRGLVWTHQSGHRDRFLLPEIMGGGAALFDMDADGDLDAYLVQSGEVQNRTGKGEGNRLFRNDGRGFFSDVTANSGAAAPGYGMGVAAGDVDNDGDTDLYVTNLDENVLLLNDGRGQFTNVTRKAGVGGAGWSTSAAFLDYDTDGWLDLFVARYIDWSVGSERECYSLTGVLDYCSPKNYDAPTSALLFHNQRDGTFVDVSARAGLTRAVGNGLGVVAADFDADGRLDIFVANDGTPNHLWMNGGPSGFVEAALIQGVAIDQDGAPKAGMGVHAADVDGDGDQDLLVVNLDTEPDSYFRNEGRYFVDATVSAGLRTASRRFTRFGMALVDFDNDGVLDLYEANGRVGLQSERYGDDPYAEPNILMRGLPGARFEEIRPGGGTATPLVATSRAAAFGDVDNDGGMDVLIVNRDAAPHLLRNVVSARGHWIAFRVVDRHGRDALGAELTIDVAGRRIRRDVRAAFSYLASNDPRVHVGLGTDTRVTAVDVQWPDGQRARIGPFEADRIVTIGPPDAELTK